MQVLHHPAPDPTGRRFGGKAMNATEGRTPRLLIVDDELHVRESLSRWFIEDGYDVMAASSGKEALAELGRQAFDAVITDIRMPGMDGLDLQRRIRETNPDVAIVLITA